MNKTVLTYQFVRERLRVVDRLGVRVFGIPRGGHEVVKMLAYATVVDHVSQADIIIDDIVDSGKTRDEWMAKAPGKEFFAILGEGTRRGCAP
jgi:hypothetical protein